VRVVRHWILITFSRYVKRVTLARRVNKRIGAMNELDTDIAIAFFKARGFSEVHSIRRFSGTVMGRAGSDWVAGLNQQGETIEVFAFDDVQRYLARGVVKPLLVLSYRSRLTPEQLEAIKGRLHEPLTKAGWVGIVCDQQSEDKVQGFGADLPTLDVLSLDSIIELLDGVRRAKEAAQVDRGFNS
jgi:hypothetical protein